MSFPLGNTRYPGGGSASWVDGSVAAAIINVDFFGSPEEGGSHSLTANGLASTPALGTPALTQRHTFTANGLTATPVVGTPALTQRHALTASGLVSTPVFGTPALTVDGVIEAPQSSGGNSRPWRRVRYVDERDSERLRAAQEEARRLAEQAEQEEQEQREREAALVKALRRRVFGLDGTIAAINAALEAQRINAERAEALREQARQAEEFRTQLAATRTAMLEVNAEIAELRLMDRNRKLAAVLLLMN